jgi:hypothetical protein
MKHKCFALIFLFIGIAHAQLKDVTRRTNGANPYPQLFFGTAAPGSVSGNLPGDFFSDTTNHNMYWCNATSGTAAPACTSVAANGWTLLNGGGGGSGTVTSITCNGGLTGGTITTSGTCAEDTTANRTWTGTIDFTGATVSLPSVFVRKDTSATMNNGVVLTTGLSGSAEGLVVTCGAAASVPVAGQIGCTAAGLYREYDGTNLNYFPYIAGSGNTGPSAPAAGFAKFNGSNFGLTSATIATSDLPVVENRRTCVIDNDTQSATVLVAANFSGRCIVPYAATIVEVDVIGGTGVITGSAAAPTITGTSSIQIGKYTPNGGASTTGLLSGALAMASGKVCALTSTSGTCINGTTSSNSITISTTSIAAGDMLYVSAATADGAQTWATITIIYTVN